MIMKLKSKDEVTVKLIEKLEEYERLSHIPQKDIDNGYDDSKRLMTLGKVNMLKWILGIPREEYEPRIEL